MQQIDPQNNPQIQGNFGFYAPQANQGPQNIGNQNFNNNVNPQMINMMPQMSPQQQQMQREFIIRQGREMGQTLLKQKQLMEQIQRNRALREQARKTEELTLFFIYNDDILPINIKANKFIPELLEIYMNKSGKRDVKFFFKEEELKYNDTSARELNEIKGLVSGEEIIVKDIV